MSPTPGSRSAQGTAGSGQPGVLCLAAPPSKSVTHRAFVLASLADRPVVIERPLLGADCRSTLEVLRGLGARWTIEANGDVHFEPSAWGTAETTPGDGDGEGDGGGGGGGEGDGEGDGVELDCGNSGTSLRLLAAQAARLDRPVTLTGDRSLQQRPNGPLIAALGALGVDTESNDGRCPLLVCGPLRGGTVRLPGGLSSQYASALLLALAVTPRRSTVFLDPPIASRPYLDLTLSVAAAFGVSIGVQAQGAGLRFDVPGGVRPRASRYRVEGDWSGAAFPLVAAALLDRPLRLDGLAAESTQGDRKIVEVIERFGVALGWCGDELVVRGARLRAAGEIDVAAMPDLFPPLCALAACAPGTTRLFGSRGLRHKESDRIDAMAVGLAAMGISCDQLDDGIVIRGGQPRGAVIACRDDHRVHMAFAVIGLISEGPTRVDAPECVAVSYPGFHVDLQRFVDASGEPPNPADGRPGER